MSAVEENETVADAAAAASGRSQAEIEAELSSGVVLEGGATIDFASVKDETSRAELALIDARKIYLGGGTKTAEYGVNEDGKRLMGINDEVVAEVGREVGTFVTKYPKGSVQGCAQWLRSRARARGIALEQTEDDANASGDAASFTDEQVASYRSFLDEAYEESGIVTEAFAKTFYLGTKLMPEEAQKAIWAIYVWCRRTDEIVDAPRGPDDPDMLTDLSAWEIRTEELWRTGEIKDALDLPLLDVRLNYPKLDIAPFLDMVRGMLMDIPDLGQDRYETFDELHLYCYRVAGTVGLMTMPVFGCAPGYTEKEAK